MEGRISGYSVHANDTRAVIEIDGLTLRGIGCEIMSSESFAKGGKEQFPTFNIEEVEQVAHLLPQKGFGVLALVRLLKERTAGSLDLVNQKGEHHQH